MAQRFVIPLVKAEKNIGIRSRIVYGEVKLSKNFNISTKSLLMLPYIYYKINSYIKKNSPQVVIAHNSTSSLLPLLSARMNGVKRIIYFNHGIPFLAYNGILRIALNFLEILICLLLLSLL